MIGIKDQYFGTEIEMTGITRQRAAEVVAELFGTEAFYDGTYYGVWSVRDQEGKKWKFMSDGSIDTQRKSGGQIVSADREYSTEMVSPKLSYDEMGVVKVRFPESSSFGVKPVSKEGTERLEIGRAHV